MRDIDEASLHWRCGYEYAMRLVAEAADDVSNARSLPPVAMSHEERVQKRMDEMERLYGPPRYKGGPVASW